MPIDVKNAPLVHDNEELVRHANVLLVRMCGVVPPRSMIGPLLSAIFSAIQTSPVRYLPVSVTVPDSLFVVMEGSLEGPTNSTG
jgi:hypothetical protein